MGRHAGLLHSGADGECIHDRCKHADIISSRAIHTAHTRFRAAPDVTATHHNGNLQITLLLSLCDFTGNARHDFRGNIVLTALRTQSLTAQLEQYPLVLGRG